MNNKFVWYVAYGSNTTRIRFLYYIQGGFPPGASGFNRGCTDKTFPKSNKKIILEDFKLCFCKQSKMWENKGVAFIKRELGSIVYGRAYLITLEQFIEIFAQENKVDSRHLFNNFQEEFEKLLTKEIKELNLLKRSNYGKLLILKEEDGFPVITFTNPTPCNPNEYIPPSKTYLKTLIRGLLEIGIDEKTILKYLKSASGMETFDENDIKKILKEIKEENTKLQKGFFIVSKTMVRPKYKDFFAQFSAKRQKELQLKKGDVVILKKKHQGSVIKAPASFDPSYTAPVDEVVHIDQKLRVAIGAKEGDLIEISKAKPLKRSPLKKLLLKFLGIRPQLMRVQKASFEDMEMNICRIPEAEFELLGIRDGDFVEIESTESILSLKAIKLTKDDINLRKEIMKKEPARFLNCYNLLELKRLTSHALDLPWIFLDLDQRLKLKVNQCDVVKVYRDVKHSLYKELRHLSIPLILSILGIVVELNLSSFLQLILIAMGITISVVFLFLEIRNRVI